MLFFRVFTSNCDITIQMYHSHGQFQGEGNKNIKQKCICRLNLSWSKYQSENIYYVSNAVEDLNKCVCEVF